MMEMEGESEWSLEGPTLSNDIWKKFELIPTPPRSPLHEVELSLKNFKEIDFKLDFTSLTEYLQSSPNDLLDNFEVDLENIDLLHGVQGCGLGGLPCAHGTCTSCTQLALAGSELRHDCMWRGTCTAEAHAHHQHDTQQRPHRDSHISDLLDGMGALESSAGFTNLADLHVDDDEEDEDEDMDDDDLEAEGGLTARPDTPSESSETDTDEEDPGMAHEDEDDEQTSHLPPLVHVDHSYHCPRVPPTGTAHAPALPSTPSESEDEIDVVSVGSTDSAYSTSSNRSINTRVVVGQKRKRSTDDTTTATAAITSSSSSSSRSNNNSHNQQQHYLSSIASISTASTTTPLLPAVASVSSTVPATYIAAASTATTKKVLKVRTNSLPAKPNKQDRKDLQQAVAVGVKRRATLNSNTATVGLLRRIPASSSSTSSSSSSRRIQSRHRNSQRKKRSGRDTDDPDKRNLHNSLERMRRVDLRNAFEDLRVLVPDLCEREKAPKVEILRKASEYCYSLTQRGRLVEQERARQRQRLKVLSKRLEKLRAECRS